MHNAIFTTIFMLASILAPLNGEARMHIEKRDYSQLWAQEFDVEQSLPNVPYRETFIKAGEKYNLPPMLLAALARGESSYNPVARSAADCFGLLQLKWETAKDMGMLRRSHLIDPEKNIFTGAKYLRWLVDQHKGDIHRALCAYNYGIGRIHPSIAESRIPDGANWYSGYIYYHYNRLQDGTGYDPEVKGRQPLLAFDDPDRALVIMDFLKRVEGIRLDCARVHDGRTAVVLVYHSNSERISALRKLRNYGMDNS